ncbi:SDR family oxidoreductase [Actinoplanes sp. L3-i22]|uniref:SDR family oxidoreductase n=1 Tax=Actinoplanes sp. L3-i22 TaxID=2836373 RepID=UPI001C765A36|nr:SDR family oxidoreductase [Actinoplanes sp. L3-i22]BCY10785.1 short-chain dehydrogenase [Actinoplanes sp. L3-i22]
MISYAGKTAVVAGGTSGIGLAIAALLSAEGARVLVTGRSAEALAAARDKHGVLTVRSDATVAADRAGLAERVRAELGPVDGLFVNAGVAGAGPFEQVTEAEYDRVMDGNTRAPYFTVQSLSPLLAPGAGVVLTTSIVNESGPADLSVYSASKAALRSLARTLGRELLPRRIRVNAVSPGPIDTGILQRSLPAEVAGRMIDEYTAANPMRRMGEPDEVARAAAFLAFDATFTTGAELAVDGGASQL